MCIHPTAVVPWGLELPSSCEIGPYSIIEKGVVFGKGVIVGARCHVYASTRLGDGCRLFDGVIVGSQPQDLKYQGEPTCTLIGSGTQIREYVTINCGTAATGRTQVGEGCMIMAYAHVAHDCCLGNRVVIANGVQMGGHVTIGDATTVSGLTGIHQFTTIGPGAFIGGGLRVARDILPFTRALGEPLSWAGVNQVGVTKLGYDVQDALKLKRAFRMLGIGGQGAFIDYISRELPSGIDKIFKDFFRDRVRGYLK